MYKKLQILFYLGYKIIKRPKKVIKCTSLKSFHARERYSVFFGMQNTRTIDHFFCEIRYSGRKITQYGKNKGASKADQAQADNKFCVKRNSTSIKHKFRNSERILKTICMLHQLSRMK